MTSSAAEGEYLRIWTERVVARLKVLSRKSHDFTEYIKEIQEYGQERI
jgi:hypothetical protein